MTFNENLGDAPIPEITSIQLVLRLSDNLFESTTFKVVSHAAQFEVQTLKAEDICSGSRPLNPSNSMSSNRMNPIEFNLQPGLSFSPIQRTISSEHLMDFETSKVSSDSLLLALSTLFGGRSISLSLEPNLLCRYGLTRLTPSK